jgi:hypothetical protein
LIDVRFTELEQQMFTPIKSQSRDKRLFYSMLANNDIVGVGYITLTFPTLSHHRREYEEEVGLCFACVTTLSR